MAVFLTVESQGAKNANLVPPRWATDCSIHANSTVQLCFLALTILRLKICVRGWPRAKKRTQHVSDLPGGQRQTIARMRKLVFAGTAASTALCALLTLCALYADVPHPHTDAQFIVNALGLLLGCGAVKAVAFGWCVWPAQLGLFGVDQGSSDEVDGPPLHFACRNGSVWLVRVLLLDRGANLEHANSSGSTALQLARAKRHEGVVRMLQERGFPSPSSPLESRA